MYDVTAAITSFEDRLKQNSQFNSSLSSRMESVTKLALITALSLDEDNVVPALIGVLSHFWSKLKDSPIDYFTAWNEPFTSLMIEAAKIVSLSKTVSGAKKAETSYIYWLCPGLKNEGENWKKISQKSSIRKLGYKDREVYVVKSGGVGTGRINDNNDDNIPKIMSLVLPSIKKLFSSDRFKGIITQWGNSFSDELLTAMVNHALENHYVEHTQILSDYCTTWKREIKPGAPYLVALLGNDRELLNACALKPDVSVRLTRKSTKTLYEHYIGYSIFEFVIEQIRGIKDDESFEAGLDYIHNLIERGAIPNKLTLSLITGDYKKQIFLSIWNRLSTNKELEPLFSEHFFDFICGSSKDILDNIKVINHFISQESVKKSTLHTFFMKLFATHDTVLYTKFFEELMPQSQRQLMLDGALVAAIDGNEPDVLHLLLNKGAKLNQRWNDEHKTILFHCEKKPNCLSKICSWVNSNRPKFFYAPPEDLEKFLFKMIMKSKGGLIRDLIGIGIDWKTPEYTKTTKLITGCNGGDDVEEVFGGYSTRSLLMAALWTKDLITFTKLVACGYPIHTYMSDYLKTEALRVHGEKFCAKEFEQYEDAIRSPSFAAVNDRKFSLFGKRNEPEVNTKPSEPAVTKSL